MQEKLTLQLFACKDWKVEKMTICRWQRETHQNDKKILLKFNLDQNDFATYRNGAGLTFKIIMLNSLTLILFIPHHD